MSPKWKPIHAQFENAVFTQAQFHYDLVAPRILKVMHQLQDMLTLTSIESISTLTDPLAVTAELLMHGNLTPYERWVCLMVRQDLLEMEYQYRHDPKLRSRVERMEKRLHDLFYSIKERESAKDKHKVQSPSPQPKRSDERTNSQPSSRTQHVAGPATRESVIRERPVNQENGADTPPDSADDDSEEDFVMVDDPRTLVVEL